MRLEEIYREENIFCSFQGGYGKCLLQIKLINISTGYLMARNSFLLNIINVIVFVCLTQRFRSLYFPLRLLQIEADETETHV